MSINNYFWEKREKADLLEDYRNPEEIRYRRCRGVLKSYWFCLLFMQLLAIHTDDEDLRNAARKEFSRFQAFPGLIVLMAYPFPGISAFDRYDSN